MVINSSTQQTGKLDLTEWLINLNNITLLTLVKVTYNSD